MISRKFAKDRDLVTNYEVRPNIYANIFTDFGEKNLTLLNEFFSAGSQYLITPTLDDADHPCGLRMRRLGRAHG